MVSSFSLGNDVILYYTFTLTSYSLIILRRGLQNGSNIRIHTYAASTAAMPPINRIKGNKRTLIARIMQTSENYRAYYF